MNHVATQTVTQRAAAHALANVGERIERFGTRHQPHHRGHVAVLCTPDIQKPHVVVVGLAR